MPVNPLRRRLLIAILVLSVLLRVGVAFYYGDQVPEPPNVPDDTTYSLVAEQILAGNGYTLDQPWYPFGKPAGYPTAHWSFLYTALVAGVYAVFGIHPLAVRLLQAVLGGFLLPWLVYRLAHQLWSPSPPPPAASPPPPPPLPILGEGEGAGGEGVNKSLLPLLAAALAALYAYFILYAARPVTETLYIVALLWSLEVSLRLGRCLRQGACPSWSLPLRLGAGLGIAALLRQSILPWTPLLFAWLLWQAWRGLPDDVKRWNVQTFKHLNVPTLFVAGLILLAFILPFTVRNYLVYDQFLLLNSNTGYAMYSAQHPMHGTRFQEHDAAPLPEDLRGSGLEEPELDRELMRRGIGFVLDEPGRYLLLSLSRVEDYFRFWPTADSGLLYNVGRVLSFGLYLPFMLYGLVLAARDPRLAFANSLLFLFMAFYSLLHILTWAMVRYRLPVDAVLMPYTALAVADLAARLRNWSHKRRAGAG